MGNGEWEVGNWGGTQSPFLTPDSPLPTPHFPLSIPYIIAAIRKAGAGRFGTWRTVRGEISPE
jgi:hypothetical protein